LIFLLKILQAMLLVLIKFVETKKPGWSLTFSSIVIPGKDFENVPSFVKDREFSIQNPTP